MAKSSTLSALLAAEEEPNITTYNRAVDAVIQDAQQISCLMDDDVKIHLTTHSNRLAQFFRLLRVALPSVKPPMRSNETANKLTGLVAQLLPDLHELLEPRKLNRSLIPALEICVAPSQPRGLRTLGKVLGGCGNLLEYLASDPSGSAVICRWAHLPSSVALDVETQAAWTERLSGMVSSCTGNHEVAPAIQQWGNLKALQTSLRGLEQRLLNAEAKQTARMQLTAPAFPILEDGPKNLLKAFGLPEPESRRMVQSHLETLSDGITASILRSITASFPCKRCIPGLVSTPQSADEAIIENAIEAGSDLDLDVLGRGVGIWKVLLSAPALKSVQTISQAGLLDPLRAKLIDLASGYLKSRRAGSAKQREHLKIPLWNTKHSQHSAILWQVSIGSAGDEQVPQQVIIVWEVGDPAKNSKALDRVINLQGNYSEESISRCCQRNPIANGRQLPAYFKNDIAGSAKPSADFDVRTVDQETIAMANKFYALTEPVFRAVLANDLAAEFPFDLSGDEARCVRHFQTASLILGRSGTGKTTCLIFKMVGKFLASKSILDERPPRQVLLTRSMYLAEKLKSHTRRLIDTLLSNSSILVSIGEEEHVFSKAVEEDRDDDSVITLNDSSFPLVCTFDRFLQLLENTAVALDRQDFSDVEAHASTDDVACATQSHQQQLVDFYAFRVNYWPRFSQMLTKGLSVHLVFAEIMGVIKGSESSRDSLIALGRAEYLKRSSRLAPNFSLEAERSRVYDIFESYEALKHQYGAIDYVDRVVEVLRGLQHDPSLLQVLRSNFDEIYVDEIQDQRCLDIELFLKIARNGRGFHFAGDTAQAISQDSTFRFADIKKMIFDHFAPAGDSANQHQLGHAEMFTLAKNYRSHQGILALASLVMGMIWKGFPETVDKLEPEVGDLSGPKPVLFVGCDFGILRSSGVGSGETSERSADFGAEQVILVRDTKSKTDLQNQIGDVALIFTILESKGMEFDDVILWDFFTACPDQAGVRSLTTLSEKPASYDSRKHSGMCSELKYLYVAVTRARIQLFIVETSEDTAASIQRLLADDESGALVEVTRPSHADFSIRVEMMRPSTSVDPAGWARRADDLMRRRMFKEALMPYRRAGNNHGETVAQGYLKEEEGKICKAKGDMEGFQRSYELAYDHFIKVGFVSDAVQILVALENYEKAAGVWLEHKQPSKAAALFFKAGLHLQAHECYHNAQDYTTAAATLRDGKHYDHLVSYLAGIGDKISIPTLRSYSFFCKLLLKQKKLSVEQCKQAIQLLGTSQEQEQYFIDYGMDKELMALYIHQQKYSELYRLFFKSGQLEEALRVVFTKNLIENDARVPEAELLQLLDYSWAGHLVNGTQRSFEAKLRLPTTILTPSMAVRVKDWETVSSAFTSQGPDACRTHGNMTYTLARRFLVLRRAFNEKFIDQMSTLDHLPFEMMREGVQIVKELVNKDPGAVSAVLLSMGIWKRGDSQREHILLPWSPYRRTKASDVSTIDIVQAAHEWVLDQFVAAIVALDRKAQALWTLKWPVPCPYFLTTGFCRDQTNGQCQKHHGHVNDAACGEILEDLLLINGVLCDLAVLYYRRALNTRFRVEYLSIRRRWTERLLGGLTFLSAVTQHPATITHVHAELLRGDKSPVICSSLQELLYFRLGKEWSTRNNFTSLLEQMQQAEAFGPSVQSRLFRALSHRLHIDGRDLLQGHLNLLNSILNDCGRQPAQVFQGNLRTFIRNLDRIDIPALSTLHSLTASFESIIAYLIIKTCSAECLLTQSWVIQYLPRYSGANDLVEPTPSFERTRTYHQCLVEIIKGFCRILRRLDESPELSIKFLCNGRTHNPLTLRRRNAEMLAIILANLATASPIPDGFGDVFREVQTVFELKFVRAHHLKSRSYVELNQQLALAFLKYNGKDNLLVVVKDLSRFTALTSLKKQQGVKMVPFQQLFPPPTQTAATDTSVGTVPMASPTGQEMQYSSKETEAIIKIQHFWRFYSIRLSKNRAHMSLPKSQTISRFVQLCTQIPPAIMTRYQIAIRGRLFTEGVALCLKLDTVHAAVRKLQKDAMECVEHVEIAEGIDEVVDKILSGNREADTLVNKAKGMMSDDALVSLLRQGKPLAVQQLWKYALHGGPDDFAKLPAELHVRVMMLLPDLSTLQHLIYTSPILNATFEQNHVRIVNIILSGLTLELRQAMRAVAMALTECPDASLIDGDLFDNRGDPFQDGFGDVDEKFGIPTLPSTFPLSASRHLLLVSCRIQRVSTHYFKTQIQRLNSIESEHLLEEECEFDLNDPEPFEEAPPGVAYTPQKTGPASWIERYRVECSLWRLQLLAMFGLHLACARPLGNLGTEH